MSNVEQTPRSTKPEEPTGSPERPKEKRVKVVSYASEEDKNNRHNPTTLGEVTDYQGLMACIHEAKGHFAFEDENGNQFRGIRFAAEYLGIPRSMITDWDFNIE